MFKSILRNMWRRKVRTFLTVFGIVVGIFALTVLGGLSARLTQQVRGTQSWFTGSISVVPAGAGLFGGGGDNFLTSAKIDEVRRVPGVKAAVSGIGIFLGDNGGFSFGAPDLAIGLETESADELLGRLPVESGSSLEAGDRGEVLLGSTLAEKYGARVGEQVRLEGKQFRVKGVLQPTLSAPDTFAFVPFPDGLEMFFESNPFINRSVPLASVAYVLWDEGADPEEVSGRISSAVDGVKVISPAEAERQISQFSLIFNAILLGIAFVALVVGGLSIINTMVMSVTERTREIGLKRAIGADTRVILGEYLLESSMIGLLGGLAGVGLGVVAIVLLNRATRSSNVTVFAVTWLVVAGPVLFATFLGALAGIFPALRASRLKPVESLRED